jgi:hypothetical protein
MLVFNVNNKYTNTVEKNLQKKNSSLSKKINVYKTFAKKEDAISYISENPDTKLFSDDLNPEDGSKRFIVSTYDKIYTMTKTKDKHMYENYENDQPVKLILDIDLKIDCKADDDNYQSNDDIFNDILVQSIDTINEKLKEYTDIEPIIIILKSCRKDKLSAHIIYTNIHFLNIKLLKCFMMTIDSPLIEKKIIDPMIYKVGCMRMLWNSKLGKSNNLEFVECDFMADNKYSYITDKQLFMDCLLTNIKKDSTLINFQISEPILKTKNSKNINKKINYQSDKQYNYNIKIIKQYVDLISDTRSDDYCDWLKVGMSIYNCNSSDEGFNLWDSWSKKSDKYDHDVNIWKWSTFNQGSLPRKSSTQVIKRNSTME